MRQGRTLSLTAVVMILGGCSAASTELPSTSSSANDTFDLRGELFIYADLIKNEPGAALCRGDSTHPDIHGGADIVVRGKDNQTTVGLGELDTGDDRGSLCAFTFVVKGVEGGEGFYSLTIGKQDPQQLTESEARNGYQTYYVR